MSNIIQIFKKKRLIRTMFFLLVLFSSFVVPISRKRLADKPWCNVLIVRPITSFIEWEFQEDGSFTENQTIWDGNPPTLSSSKGVWDTNRLTIKIDVESSYDDSGSTYWAYPVGWGQLLWASGYLDKPVDQPKHFLLRRCNL